MSGSGVCDVPLLVDAGHAAKLHDEPQRRGDRSEHGDEHRRGEPLVMSVSGDRRSADHPANATTSRMNPGQKRLSFIVIPACGCVVRK